MNYEIVIGVEIHAQLNTRLKLFSTSLNKNRKEANSQVNIIDFALPGILPKVNKLAVKKALQACLLLNCNIDKELHFDRKNYFYSDLTKGYQITQYSKPLGKDGFVILSNKTIPIVRVQLEEDSAKQLHIGEETILDYNRSGVPLIEIVSDCVFQTSEEVIEYLEKIKSILLFNRISDAKMEEGCLRFDINLSLRKRKQKKFGTKVEIKNLNSTVNVKKAIDYEVWRQSVLLDEGKEIAVETRRYDEKSSSTTAMRGKENTDEYAYVFEANILPIAITPQLMDEVRQAILPTFEEKLNFYQKFYLLSKKDCLVLLQNVDSSEYFEKCASLSNSYIGLANLQIQVLMPILSKAHQDFKNCSLQPFQFVEIYIKIEQCLISFLQGKVIMEEIIRSSCSVSEAMKKDGINLINDVIVLKTFIHTMIQENPELITLYQNGKTRVIDFMMAKIMKNSKGEANPKVVKELLLEEIRRKQ